MNVIEIACPLRNKPVSTGIRRRDMARWIGKSLMLRCPACNHVHSWTPTPLVLEVPINSTGSTLYLD